MTDKKPREAEEEVIDRLNDLPDHIIHIIFWFLDIRYAIQTCVLSKRWRYLWASLPNLKLLRCDPNVLSSSTFTEFVTEVLSRRDDHCNIGQLILFDWILDQSLLDMVINYAVSHQVRGFHIGLVSNLSLSLAPALLTCQSLKFLKLYRFKFEPLSESFGFGFTNLTTLDLFTCRLCYEKGDNIIGDPFSNCPNLTHLGLHNCCFSSLKLLKITGLQLLRLEIDNLGHGFSELPIGFRVEINAPKLRYFWFENSYPVDFYRLYLPSLIKVDISLWTKCSEKRKANLNLINMFKNLESTPYIWLHPQTFEILDWYPELLQQKTSHFKRLMVFRVPCMLDSFTIPAHVASYFLGSTSPIELTRVEYLKIRGRFVRTLCYRPMVQA